MARKPVTFRNLPQEAFTPKLRELLELMDQVKADVNAELLAIAETAKPGFGDDKRAVHSYKLDFSTGQRELKVAFVAKPVAKTDRPQATLADFMAAMSANGRAA